MKKWLFASTLLTMLQINSYANEIEYSGIVEVMPGNVLITNDLSNLKFSGSKNGKVIDESLENDANYIPSLSGGFEATDGNLRFQFLGGFSTLINGDLSATIIKFDAAGYYMGGYNNKFGIGLHISTLSFLSPSWSGNADVDFDDTNAVAPGIAFLYGSDFIIKGSVDYLVGSSMDITTKNATVSNYSSISLDGVMIQIGLMYKF